ncbi:PLP-dependent aminotransferase family protein [Arhodomonas sp. AD133]|uniref:MocR-like pyridoxine biosynthesis transcription factor PdxR n=1 Tax=Arhodomonas sp. AD133 TaxID=3415009 RepID=UPI003EC0506D
MSPTAATTGHKRRALYEALRADILAGRLHPGDRLPASREAARTHGCARNTVVDVYERLQAHGYVETRRGAGTFVADGAAAAETGTERSAVTPALAPAALHAMAHLRERHEQRPHGEAAVDFQYGAVAVDEGLRRAWRVALARAGHELATAYPPAAGDPRLRQAVADHLRRRRRMVVDPDRIVITDGSQQGLSLVAQALLEPGRRVVMEEPGYPGARVVFEASGADTHHQSIDSDGLVTDDLPQSASLAYATPSHQFPTGGVLVLARRRALLRWAETAGAFIFEDDYDSEFRHEGPPLETLHSLDTQGRVIYGGTFSKALSPAIRLGFLVLPPGLVEPVRALKWLGDRATTTPVQVALAELIERGEMERFIRRTQKRLQRTRDALIRALRAAFSDAVVVTGAHTGMHLVAHFPALAAEATPRLVDAAATRGVRIYPLSMYRAAEPGTTNTAAILLGYATVSAEIIPASVDALADAYRDVTAAHGRLGT